MGYLTQKPEPLGDQSVMSLTVHRNVERWPLAFALWVWGPRASIGLAQGSSSPSWFLCQDHLQFS